LLSSAILYVAIVAIWACVLIPRWLRRDSSVPSAPAGEQATDEMATGEAATGEAATGEEQSPPRRRRFRRRFRRREREDAVEERRPIPGEGRRVPAEGRRVPAEGRRVPASSGGEDFVAHRRVLSARRRLLAILIVLTIASGALAGTKLAAWWVIVPPSVMLLGYLILLKAAGKADTERREQALSATAEDSRATGAAPARRAEIIDISASRSPRVYVDRASPRVRVREEQELYDQDEDAKLRAVGD
jgi:hypothetical protein